MTVKIVTDSLSDITDNLAKELDLTIVPLYVRFGESVYRDRVDITTEEFYRRLVTDTNFPATTQPSPADYAGVYEKLAKETDEILVITVSSKLSGTFQSATQAKALVKGKSRIEVIDSLTVAMGLGLVVIDVAGAVKAGAKLDDAAAYVRSALPRSHFMAYFDTLKYLAKGGRIGKAQGLLGSMLSIKPILTVREGEMAPLTRVRSLNAGVDYLFNTISTNSNVKMVAVEHSTSVEAAEKLVEKVGTIFPKERIYRSVISPVLGTYGGPDAMALTFLEGEKK